MFATDSVSLLLDYRAVFKEKQSADYRRFDI